MIGRRQGDAVAVPRFRPRGERAFGVNALDLRLSLYLKFRNGFFVEAGANDGLTQSNTAFFERYRGWQGLLIEPLPALAGSCRANRPGSLVEQCALVAEDYGGRTIPMRYSGLMSLVAGGRGGEAEDRAHVARGHELQGGLETYELEVPARTLSSLLEQHGIEHVDLLSLDLEGYEPQALRGLDLARHGPEFILVEVWNHEAVRAALEGRYDRVAVLSRQHVADSAHEDVLYRRRERSTADVP